VIFMQTVVRIVLASLARPLAPARLQRAV